MSLLWEHTAAALRAGDFLWRDQLDVSQLEKEVGQPARPQQTRLSPPHIDRMPRVERPTIEPDIAPVTMQLKLLLSAIMATLAKRLQLTREKFHAVAMMRLDVIDNLSRHNFTCLRAELAQWMFAQLVPTNFLPARRAVQRDPGTRFITRAQD
jgi:hypothetical protein